MAFFISDPSSALGPECHTLSLPALWFIYQDLGLTSDLIDKGHVKIIRHHIMLRLVQ